MPSFGGFAHRAYVEPVCAAPMRAMTDAERAEYHRKTPGLSVIRCRG